MRSPLALALILAACSLGCVSDGGEEPAKKEPKIGLKELLERAKEDPEDFEHQVALGFYFWRYEKDFNRARIHYEEAVRLAGPRKYTPPHYLLGIVYWEMGEHDEALVQFENTYNVPQKDGATFREDVYYRQSQWLSAKIYAKEKKDLDKALLHLGRFHEMGGSLNDQTEVYEAITKVYIEQKDIENAGTYLEKVRKLAGPGEKTRNLEYAIDELKREIAAEEKVEAERAGTPGEGS